MKDVAPPSTDRLEELAFVQTQANLLPEPDGVRWIETVVGALGTVLILGSLVHLLTGERPRHGTRWFWFWVMGMFAGLGVLLYAVLEVAPWRDSSAPAPDRRPGGWGGFALTTFVSFVLGMLWILVRHLTHLTLLPL